MSRVDNEDAVVTELDGQPRAYMEISDEHSSVRLVYRMIGFLADSEELANQTMDDSLAALHVELKANSNDSIIFWRRKPERATFHRDHEQMTGHWYASYRCAVSPPLSQEAWNRVGFNTDARIAYSQGTVAADNGAYFDMRECAHVKQLKLAGAA